MTGEASETGRTGAGRIAPLDGLRGVAVGAVVLFHAFEAAFPGGFLGVDLFFVASGFIITALLREEYAATGRVDLAAFFRRRARRILPALVALLVAWCLYVALARLLLGSARDFAEPAVALAGLMNWMRALAIRSGGELGHLWSLSVEEQFYLVWPLVFARLAAGRAGAGRLLGWLAGAALCVALWRMGLQAWGASPERTYNGTDTRADALLIGCALAFVPRGGRLARGAQRFVAVPVLLLAATLFLLPDWRVGWLHGPGFTAMALCFAWLILAALGDPAQLWPRLLGGRALGWLGRRSYSLYLWHYPLLTLPAFHGVPAPLLAIAASLAAADLSYRLVERPFLTRRAGVGI